MLVHICCSVDSHYFLSELKKIYPDEKMIGFFYNPNIHPRSEYDLRLLDVKRSCQILRVELIEGQYDDEVWNKEVRGLEDEPEKGARCNVCFDVRLIQSAKLARKLGEKVFTTTLLSSPMKTQDILFSQGEKIAQDFGLEFIKIDVRSQGGTQKQNELSKKDKLYRQNYCGCKFALQKQREKQGRFPLEFISPIHQQVMKGSIEYRNEVFNKRMRLEEEEKSYILVQQKQLIWRCLQAKLEVFGACTKSYVVTHSQSKKNIRLGALSWVIPKNFPLKIGRVGISKRDDTLIFTLKAFNEILKLDYKNLDDLLLSPPPYMLELSLREKIGFPQSINPILVVEHEFKEDARVNIQSIFQEEAVFEVLEV
ncbi:epoxyqueuosine reductase QueH [Helicobacter cholecystus]|uniref:epoxyqueuosine reductase QueH n=1 Tax=Helicobacter cholecystus TaxID=45498 RepID=UPI002739EC59|nr:epoxyqueuosine reductase QueH [Helicobacter cholecystus]